MECIKTGFIAEIAGLYAHGDAFAIWHNQGNSIGNYARGSAPPATLLLRVCAASAVPPRVIHIQVNEWDRWFDEHRADQSEDDFTIWNPNSTLIAMPNQWLWHGYSGVEL